MIGVGFITLIVVWTTCILLSLVFARCEGSLAYTGVCFMVVAVIISLVLWFYPRGEVPKESYVVYDNTYLLRTGIVSSLGVMLLIGLLIVAVVHVFDQHRATAIKPWTY